MTIRNRRALLMPNLLRRSMAYPRGRGQHVIGGHSVYSGSLSDRDRAFHAYTYDPDTYEMLGIRTGIGDIDVARASERDTWDVEEVSYSVNAYEIAWYGGRNVWNRLRYSEDLENEVWIKTANVSVSGKEVTFTESDSSLRNYASDRTFSVSSWSEYVSLTLTDEFVRYSYHGNFEGQYCVWSAYLKSGTTTKCKVRLYFGKNNGSCFQIKEDGDYDNDTIFLDKVQLEVVTTRTEKTIPSEYQPTDTAISDELVTNGTFDADTDWNKYGDDGAGQDTEIAGGQARLYSNGVDRGVISQSIGFKYGVTYRCIFEDLGGVDNRRVTTSNSITGLTTVDAITDWDNTLGVITVDFTASGDATYLCLRALNSAGAVAVFDNVTVEEVSTGRKVYGCANPNTVDIDHIVTLGPRVPFAQMPWASGAPAATNILFNSSVAGARELTVTVGTWSVHTHVNAGDSATAIVTAGTATATGYGTSSPGSPIELDVTVGGTINIEITGTPVAVNLLSGDIAITRGIPPIPTEGSTVSIQADGLSADILNHNNEEVCYVLDLMLSYDYDEKSTNEFILSLRTTGSGLAYDASNVGYIRTRDGTTQTQVTGLTYPAGDILKVGIRASISSNEMAICVDGVWSAPVVYDGYEISAALQMMVSNYEMKMRELSRYDIKGSEAQQARIDELMYTGDTFTLAVESVSTVFGKTEAFGDITPATWNGVAIERLATNSIFIGSIELIFEGNFVPAKAIRVSILGGSAVLRPNGTTYEGTSQELADAIIAADGATLELKLELANPEWVDPPVFDTSDPMPDGTAGEGTPTTPYEVARRFQGGGEVDTYSLVGGPAWFVIDPITGLTSGTPDVVGPNPGIVARATNAAGYVDTNEFSILVTALLDPPLFNGPDISDIDQQIGVPFSLDVSSRFSGAGVVDTYLLDGNPSWLSIDTSGVMSGTPTIEESVSGVTVTAYNGAGEDVSNAFSVSAIEFVIVRGHDYFIDEDGTALEDHLANPFWDWTRGATSGQSDFEWVWDTGDITIRNDLGTPSKPNFRAACTVGIFSRCISDRKVAGDCIVSARMYCPDTDHHVGLSIRYVDTANYINVRLRGSVAREQVQIQSVVGGTFATLETGSVGSIKSGREHLVELELVGDTLYTYIDNVLQFAGGTDVSAVQGTKWALRCDGGYYQDFNISPHRTINRRYISNAGNDATGDGSYSTPWATLGKLNSQTAANSAGYRYCLKAGDTWNGVITPQGSGTGTNWLDCNPLEIGAYEPSVAAERAEINRLTTISSGSWSGPDGNGEYTLSSQTQSVMVLVEDDVRINGATSAQSTSPYIPAPGSLSAGEWALNGGTDVLYYKPSTGVPSDHVVQIATQYSTCAYLNTQSFTFLSDLYLHGTSATGGVVDFSNGGSYLWIHNSQVANSTRGVIVGGGSGHQTHYRQTEMEVWGVWYKALGTIYGGVGSSASNGYVGHSYIHDLARNSADWGDQEGVMFSPGSDHAILEFVFMKDIGWADTSLIIPSTFAVHPELASSDSADDIIIRYCFGVNLRLRGIVASTREQSAITQFHAYNNVLYNVDTVEPNGSALRSTRSGLQFRSQLGFDCTATMEYNSIIKAGFARPTELDGAIVFFATGGGKVTNARAVNNLISHFTGVNFIQSYADNASGPNDYECDYNLYHRLDAQTTAVEIRKPFVATVTYDMNHFIGGTGAGWWDYDEGQDVNSIIGDPLFVDYAGGDFRPAANSPAKGSGGAPGFSDGLDFYLRPRTGNTIGAIEAES